MYNNLLSKKSKKAISALLASALVISAAPTSVAEAAVTKTFTLGVGKTATKTVSATIKSVKTSKKAVVTVKKVAAKKYKLTAKKAGKATVTVKYGKKTLKATVKVGATKVTKKAFNATMKVNETQSLKIGTTNGKKDTIQWSTSDPNVVSIAKTSTKASAKGNTSVVATAVAAGTAKVTAKSKFTGKKATFAITVEADATATPAPTVDTTVAPTTDVTVAPTTDATTAPTATPEIKSGVTAKVQNEIPGYANVVFVNDNAIVTVSVKDDAGKPLANKTVIMSAQTFDNPKYGFGYEVKGNTVVTTNEKGEASFLIGLDNNGVLPSTLKDKKAEITDEWFKGSASYTATVVGENKSYSGYVGFAAIGIEDIDWDGDDNTVTTDDLVPGANAKNTGDYGIDTYSETNTMNNKNAVQYIGAQQVSSKGTTEHQVTFSTMPMIYLPSMSADTTETKAYVQPVNEVSGKYGTYDKKEVIIEMKKDMSMLQYATLNFNRVQLSKYTKMTIECFSDVDCDLEDRVKLSNGFYTYEVAGELDQENFAYQIPKGSSEEDNVKAIKVTILSEGQVQTNRNDGFDIRDITAVYDAQSGAVDGVDEPLKSAKITWEAVTPIYSEIKELSHEKAEKLGIVDAETKTDSTFTYQVPVFPYTGNAVIKEYDANGVLVKYYVAPTEKKSVAGKANTNDIILDQYVTDAEGNIKKNSRFKKAYQVSEEEALTRNLEGVTQTENGNSVTVNSEKVGSTTIQGTITIDGIGSGVLNDATSKVYTSVHWNPIPNKAEEVLDSEAAIALAGQKMTVYAQLTDKNGNPVSLSEKDVKFYADDTTGKEVAMPESGKVTGDEKISVIEVTKTDVNGRAKLVVSAAEAEQLLAVHAEVADDDYNVVLTVGAATEPSDKVDLYWVDANLQFKSSVDYEVKNVTEPAVTTDNNTVAAEAKAPIVGTPWEFGFKTVADTLEEGILDEYSVTIEDLKIKTIDYKDENGGTYEEIDNGKFTAETIYVNKDKITAKLGADSVGSTVKFVVTKGTDKKEYVCAGEGTPNINARIDLSIDWQAVGTVVSIMPIEGTSIDETDGVTKMYIKVTDNNGVNPLRNKEVTIKTNNDGDKLVSGTVSGSSIKVKTNAYGIAEFTLEKGAGSVASIVTAKVENTNQTASQTINWVKKGNELAVLRARKIEDNKIEVTFNNDIYAGSVVANEFKLTGEKDNKTVTYSVKDATVSGAKVILTIGETLDAGEYTVTVQKYVKDTVEYNLVDERGQKVTKNDKINFYSSNEATYDVSAIADTNVINVTNVISPVVTSGTAINANIIVTVNGKVVNYEATQVTEGKLVTAYELKLLNNVKLEKDDVVRVCYMGAMESFVVK